MESRVLDAVASEAERASEGTTSGGAAPGHARSSSLGAARWKLLRQVRESPLASPPPLATPLSSPGSAGQLLTRPHNFVRSPLRHLSVPPKGRIHVGLCGEGAPNAEFLGNSERSRISLSGHLSHRGTILLARGSDRWDGRSPPHTVFLSCFSCTSFPRFLLLAS